MSKEMNTEDYFATGRSIFENYQRSLIMAVEKFNENQKKLIESTSEFYAAYFSITNDMMRKSFDYYSSLMSNLPTYTSTFLKYQPPSRVFKI